MALSKNHNGLVSKRNKKSTTETAEGVVELKITIRLENGDVYKVDMNNDVQKIFLSMVFNFFKPNVPFVKE